MNSFDWLKHLEWWKNLYPSQEDMPCISSENERRNEKNTDLLGKMVKM